MTNNLIPYQSSTLQSLGSPKRSNFFYWGLTSLFTLFTEILLLGTKFVNLGPAGPSFFPKVEPCLKDFLHFRGKET